MQGLASNGRWAGLPLRKVLGEAGLKSDGREIVFFGSDHKEDTAVDFRGQNFTVDQQFGRSLTREEAMAPESFLAYALNGEPLTVPQGFPLRLIVPGWYHVANVKWLSQIHVQEDRYLGNYEARWYRTLKGEMIDGEMKWVETAISRMRLKSVIAARHPRRQPVRGSGLRAERRHAAALGGSEGGRRLVAAGGAGIVEHEVFVEAVHLRLEESGGRRAHTRVARHGYQRRRSHPEAADLVNKKSFLEDNGQFPRKVMIA